MVTVNRYNDGNPPIISVNKPVTNKTITQHFDIFHDRYDFFESFEIGKSIRGRPIMATRLGDVKAKTSILYVGAHHGMEWITSGILLRYINEYCEAYKNEHTMYGINTSLLYSKRSIYVVPLLNPDGVNLAINGRDKESPLYNRLICMNDGKDDFREWQANERGVDLNHNYNAGFTLYKSIEKKLNISNGKTKYSGEYPESDPETHALASFIRTVRPDLILTFHTQGEEIYYTSDGIAPEEAEKIGRKIAFYTGYSLSAAEGTAAYGGLTDWFIKEFLKPSFTIECGKGKNPLPLSDFSSIYSRLREALWLAPTLI